MDRPLDRALHDLEHRLASHVSAILGAAIAAPPGGGNAWNAVLAHYGARPDAPVSRLEALGRTGQGRGAIVDEVRRALDAMVAGARAELERVAPATPLGSSAPVPSDPATAERLDTLRAHLTRVTDDALDRYVAAVLPPRAAVASSVGSLFANAQATAQNAPWAKARIDAARVLECHGCGAPQEVALDFTCRYCKSPMARPGPP